MSDDLPLADELAVVFSRMSGLLLSQETVDTMVTLITDLATSTIPAAGGCAVSLMDDRGRRTTAGSTDPFVAAADDLQYDLDEGPCIDAWRTRSVVRIDDTRSDGRYTRWEQAVQLVGVRSVLSAPLVGTDRALGAMKIYAGDPSAFGVPEEQLLVKFAAQASISLANMRSLEEAKELSDHLREALHTRDVISTAKGVLMARDGVDDSTAFAMLVSVSQRENRKLRDVAMELLATLARRTP